MIKAVIFDMDGVLFDTEKLAVKCWDEIGVKAGLGKSGYMVYKTLGRTKEESVKIFEKEFGTRFNNEVFQKYYREYLNEYYKNNPVPKKEGLDEILSYLKDNNYKIAVASSSGRNSVLHHLDDAKITDYFDVIICGDMVKRSKPEPDIYLTAAKKLNVPASECIAVEDSESGLNSAHCAGMTVVYIPDLYIADNKTKEIIDLSFENLIEFKKYLNSKGD